MLGLNSQASCPSEEPQPNRSGADLVVACLADEGITSIFGVPGTTVMDLIDSCARREDVKYISARHEQVAGFMADGFSRAGQQLGVCLASRGPGAANLAVAVHNAFDESIPMLVLIGQVPSDITERRSFEDMDVIATFSAMTKWTVEIREVARIPELLQRAIRTAASGRPGPVVVSLPLDVLQATSAAVPAVRRRSFAPAPSLAGLVEATNLLVTAKRPVIILGGGTALADWEAFTVLAERLVAPVVTTWLRQNVFPHDHQSFVGGLGYGAHDITESTVREADVVLAIGCRFSEFTTKRWTLLSATSRLVHIDIDPVELGRVYLPDVGLVSDAGAAAVALADALTPRLENEPGALRNRTDRLRNARRSFEAARSLNNHELTADRPGSGVSGIDTVRAVQRLVDRAGVLIVQDAPSFGTWNHRHLNLTQPRSFYGSSGGAMAWGFPAAMGLAVARSDKRIVTISGDGSFWMVAQDFETCVREKLPLINIVMNNFSYGNTRDRQRFAHDERYLGVFYGNPDFAAFARLVGGHGERVESAAQLDDALDRCLAQSKPAIVDILQDPMYGLPPGVKPPAAE